jgi:hypothetical protein
MIRDDWRNAALVLLSVFVFGALFRLGIALEMDRGRFSFRFLSGRQVAAALDSLVPGEPVDYMAHSAIMDIASHYWNTDHHVPLNAIVEEARAKIANDHDHGTRLMVWDDKGHVDLLRMSFRLFGLHRQSVYYTYFLILGMPMCVYAALFFRSRAHLFVLLAVLVTLYVTAPILVLNDQVYSLTEQRFFSVVGVVPVLTVLLVMSEARLSLGAVLAVLFQVAMLAFVYHGRNDSLWQPIAIVVAVPLFWWRLRGCFPKGRLAVGLAWPLVLLAAAFYGLDRYKHHAFNPLYFQEGRDSHLYTHNLIMGLSYDPRLAAAYDLAVDDNKVIRFVGRRMVARGELKVVDDAFPVFVQDSNRYSQELRAGMFDIVKTHPVECVLSVLYKARPIVREFAYIAGYAGANPIAVQSGHVFMPEHERQARGLYYRPFRPMALLCLVAGAVLALGARPIDWRNIRLTAFMIWVGGLLVPVSSIPMMYILGPTFVTTLLLGYLAVVSTIMIQADRGRVSVPA